MEPPPHSRSHASRRRRAAYTFAAAGFTQELLPRYSTCSPHRFVASLTRSLMRRATFAVGDEREFNALRATKSDPRALRYNNTPAAITFALLLPRRRPRTSAIDPMRTRRRSRRRECFTLGNTNKIASLLSEIGRSAVKAGTPILTYDFCTAVISIDHERAQCRTINCTIGLKVWNS